MAFSRLFPDLRQPLDSPIQIDERRLVFARSVSLEAVQERGEFRMIRAGERQRGRLPFRSDPDRRQLGLGSHLLDSRDNLRPGLVRLVGRVVGQAGTREHNAIRKGHCEQGEPALRTRTKNCRAL